jgi:hypothetical protein
MPKVLECRRVGVIALQRRTGVGQRMLFIEHGKARCDLKAIR